MSASVAPATTPTTTTGGCDQPAQHHQQIKKNQEDQITSVSVPVDDPPSEEPKGMDMLLVQSTDSQDSPGAVPLLKDVAATPTPGPGLVRELRGWLMVLATLVASITYASGLSPPGGFEKVVILPHQPFSSPAPAPALALEWPFIYISDPRFPPGTTPGGERIMMVPLLYLVSPVRCRTFYYSNTAALALSLSIILLLGSQDLGRLAKVKALEILVGLDVMALLVAYIAAASFGSLQLLVCAGLVLVVPVALLVMSSRLCGKYFWDEL